jgi:hypothetical protein
MNERMPLFTHTEEYKVTYTFWDDPDLVLQYFSDVSHEEAIKDCWVEYTKHKNTSAYYRLNGLIMGRYDLKVVEGSPNPYLVDVLKWIWENTTRDDGYSVKIACIKHCRGLTGCGLKEAKDFCEDYIF